MAGVELTFEMGFVFAAITLAVVFYSIDRVPIEMTSLVTMAALLIFFHYFPVSSGDGVYELNSRTLLAGFAEPALVAIIALLVVGQALVQTGALDGPAALLIRLGRGHAGIVIIMALIFVAILSGIMNNTPVVVIFIPIMSALAERLDQPPSRVLIPLSFAAILGGMTTLIGSSTNLLVSGAAVKEGLPELTFFEFTIPGAVLAGVGLIYLVFIAPRLLPNRSPLADEFTGETGKQFVAEIDVHPGSRLIGEEAAAGIFKALPDITVRLIQRGEAAILPPFEDVSLQVGDSLIVAATRKALTDVYSRDPDMIEGVGEEALVVLTGEVEKRKTANRILAEVVIAPASRLDGRTLAASGFRSQTGCIVLGVQRRSRMLRAGINDIRLEAGDVLLVTGRRGDVMGLRENRDVLLMEWSTRELPKRALAVRSLLIFGIVVGLAATGQLPIEIAALAGAGLMVIGRCLNVRQAARSVDRRVILLVAAALALGNALSATGGAGYVAHSMLTALEGAEVTIILSAFFLLIAAMTNVLSNNATAVLFTPIAVNMATELGVEPMVFLLAVIFGANCSFATPIAYQTNLLVMGPGHYRFGDFLRTGLPLIVLLWLTFSLFMPWYFGLV